MNAHVRTRVWVAFKCFLSLWFGGHAVLFLMGLSYSLITESWGMSIATGKLASYSILGVAFYGYGVYVRQHIEDLKNYDSANDSKK